MLADLGCAVVGPAAMAMLDAEAIDAAVLDINLNGKELPRRRRARRARRALRLFDRL